MSKALKNKTITLAIDHSLRWAGLSLLLFSLFFTIQGSRKGNAAAKSIDPREIQWQQMCETVTYLADNYEGDVGIYIKDLKNGRTFERSADLPFVSASLIKLPIMVATFEAIKDGKINLQSKVRYNRKYRREGSGHLKWSRSGTMYAVSHLVYTMMTQSDNTATAMLINLLGYDYLNKTFDKYGLKLTRISPVGMSLANKLKDPTQDNYTSAREMADMLENIYRHNVVSDGLSDLMIDIMKGTYERNRLARYLPPTWQLARKTGLLRKNCHDVGIVFAPDGDYVVCVLTGHNGDYTRAKGIIASVGRQIYEYLENAQPKTPGSIQT